MATVPTQGVRQLLEQFEQTRARTQELVRTLERDDYTVQTAPYTSPPKWHLGHVSWIYEAILGRIDKSYEFYSEELSEYLNSYYQQFGVPRDKASRGAASRPTLDRIMAYFELISGRIRNTIGAGLDAEAQRLLTMGLHHECQHQELLVYDLQHMLGEQYRPARKNQPPTPGRRQARQVRIDGGTYQMGYAGEEFCYDIELPEHRVHLEDYMMDSLPVTNRQYMEFIEAGGYGDYKFWLADGWEKVQEERWEAPMYWEREGDCWMISDLAGRRQVGYDAPVCHVSFYEADAYCKWAGRRLPTEAEWEKAALWSSKDDTKLAFPWGSEHPTPERANLSESYLWRCADVGSYPGGASPSGCEQMIGDVWEWTASEFVGYPGFRTGFEEYNDKWFSGQKVLRGGSFATPSMSIRSSYRNFFRPYERWMFSGFRCAQDRT